MAGLAVVLGGSGGPRLGGQRLESGRRQRPAGDGTGQAVKMVTMFPQ
jgi:hypothetical protein